MNIDPSEVDFSQYSDSWVSDDSIKGTKVAEVKSKLAVSKSGNHMLVMEARILGPNLLNMRYKKYFLLNNAKAVSEMRYFATTYWGNSKADGMREVVDNLTSKVRFLDIEIVPPREEGGLETFKILGLHSDPETVSTLEPTGNDHLPF